jgi:predicted ABC-type ATPase
MTKTIIASRKPTTSHTVANKSAKMAAETIACMIKNSRNFPTGTRVAASGKVIEIKLR